MDNIAFDCLSRTHVEAVAKIFDFHSLAKAQKADFAFQEFQNHPTSL